MPHHHRDLPLGAYALIGLAFVCFDLFGGAAALQVGLGVAGLAVTAGVVAAGLHGWQSGRTGGIEPAPGPPAPASTPRKRVVPAREESVNKPLMGAVRARPPDVSAL